MTEAVLFLFEQRKALANHIISPLPATLQQVATALLEPLFWLGGNVTAAALGLIRSVSTVSEGAAGFVSNAPTGTLLLASLGVGVVIGTTSLLLGQQVRCGMHPSKYIPVTPSMPEHTTCRSHGECRANRGADKPKLHQVLMGQVMP